jgi:hypothetical protein
LRGRLAAIEAQAKPEAAKRARKPKGGAEDESAD